MLGLGEFAVIPVHGTTGELIRIGEWLCGDGFKNYEHAEIYVGNPPGEKPLPAGYTLGAYPGGAAYHNVPPVGFQQGWLWSGSVIPLTPEQRAKIIQTAQRLEGTPYSALDYFAIAARRLHVPDPRGELRDYIASSKHMICSQLVDYCYLQAGIHLFNDGRWPGYVTPEDLANVISDPSGITYS